MSSTSARTEFIRNASQLVQRGVEFENQRNYPVATYFYTEAIDLLHRAASEQETEEDGSQKLSNDEIQNRIEQYRNRIAILQKAIDEINNKEEEEDVTQPKTQSPEELLKEKAYFLLHQALTVDEDSENAEDQREALELYMKAVEACIEAKSQENLPAETTQKLKQIANQALERAESLKKILNPESSKAPPTLEDRPVIHQAPAANSVKAFPEISSGYINNTGGQSGSGYSEEEKKVLLKTSRINGIDYLPFMPIDFREQFNFLLLYDDKDGLLKLSPKQRKVFKGWVRPSDLFIAPKMMDSVNAFNIKQTIVSDCSFVASLAISANYERRFNKRLIRTIIYPQSKEGPVYNPYGKYMVKLWFNGVLRKVIIDDRLPVGQHNELLCSYTNIKGELWISLLEKAYMKVMGGYDFPGSNSNIDLHALTGWIPERISIPSDKDRNKTFNMLRNKLQDGSLLITVATGEIPEHEADRAGLVPTHAYAVLDIREVFGVKLLLLKNPWSHLRWKGNYSELDTVHWTTEMKQALDYEPTNATQFDNGVFWIDYASIIKFFDVLYLSWNPDLFHFKYSIHKSWDSGLGPAKDVYTIGDNPQYCLEVINNGASAVVWILLTRHITDIIDFKDNREYITVLVYDNDGKRVYYPYDPPPIHDGVRINSPHYLCKMTIPPNSTAKRYTLVISQYEKSKTIHYTLRVYSSCKFKIGEIVNNCKHRQKIVGEWKGITAGGCANHSTAINNPCFRCELKQEGKLIIDLKASKDYQIGFDVVCTNSTAAGPSTFYKKSTGAYRPGFVVLEIPNVPAGIYNIIPSTFLPGCEGPFFLNIQSTAPFDLKKI